MMGGVATWGGGWGMSRCGGVWARRGGNIKRKANGRWARRDETSLQHVHRRLRPSASKGTENTHTETHTANMHRRWKLPVGNKVAPTRHGTTVPLTSQFSFNRRSPDWRGAQHHTHTHTHTHTLPRGQDENKAYEHAGQVAVHTAPTETHRLHDEHLVSHSAGRKLFVKINKSVSRSQRNKSTRISATLEICLF